MTAPIQKPSLALSYSPSGPVFYMSTDGKMPNITVTASFGEFILKPKTPVQYKWDVSLAFNGKIGSRTVPHAPASLQIAPIQHPVINATNFTDSFRIPFKQLRGGALTVKVTATIDSVKLSAESKNLQIVGTNPTVADLAGYANVNPYFRKLMQQESSLRQFLRDGMPYFSEDDLGGVGICQITNPAPTSEEIWNWKANVDAGWRIYQEKNRIARSYPERVRSGKTHNKWDDFHALCKDYNERRHRLKIEALSVAQHSTKPTELPRNDLQIILPNYTNEELQLDTLRGFNGYAGLLHEFKPNADRNGLVVNAIDESKLQGIVAWARVLSSERPSDRGDPNYVDNVLKQTGF